MVGEAMAERTALLEVPPSWVRGFYGPPYLDISIIIKRLLCEKMDALPADRESVILDIGAGPASLLFPRNSRRPGQRVIGIDVDPVVLTNENLDEAYVTDGLAFPLPDDSVDVAQSTWLLEHIEDPPACFREIRRVLRPGGCFLFLTVNYWHPTMALFRILPAPVQQFLERKFGAKDSTGDNYPVYLRANSRRQIRRLAQESELDVIEVRCRETAPHHLRRWLPLWLPAACYVYVAQHLPFMQPIATSLYGCLRKPEQ